MILFTKMQGTGNDFIIVNCIEQYFKYSLDVLSKYLCDRNFGIGGNGVIYLFKSYKADCKMRIFNSDGTEAEMCGNGIRCVAKYLYEKGIVTKNNIKIETKIDVKNVELILENRKLAKIKVKMSLPIFELNKIPVFLPKENSSSEIHSAKIIIDNIEYFLYFVSFDNPHAVCFINNLEKINVSKVGKIIENYKYFPNKINVEFVQIIDRKNIKIKIWERGVGETLSCGTGACAAAVCGIKNNWIDNDVKVELLGGKLNVLMKENEVYLIGDSEIVFEGKINL